MNGWPFQCTPEEIRAEVARVRAENEADEQPRTAPVDVLAVIRKVATFNGGYIADDLALVEAATAELIEASRAYFAGYCRDEADDWFDENVGEHYGVDTGCSMEQHAAANRLRDALARVQP